MWQGDGQWALSAVWPSSTRPTSGGERYHPAMSKYSRPKQLNEELVRKSLLHTCQKRVMTVARVGRLVASSPAEADELTAVCSWGLSAVGCVRCGRRLERVADNRQERLAVQQMSGRRHKLASTAGEGVAVLATGLNLLAPLTVAEMMPTGMIAADSPPGQRDGQTRPPGKEQQCG